MTSPASPRLVLLIAAADLARIRAAQLRIILARSSAAESPAVVWQSLDPFEINTLAWSDDAYGLYAATAPLVPGAWLAMVSRLDEAQASYTYVFTAGASFQGPYWVAAVGAAEYGVQNAMPYASYPVLTFGLCQAGVVNGNAFAATPVSAQEVLAGRLATFAGLPRVYVWLDDALLSSTVIGAAGSNAAVVEMSRDSTTTLIFDPDLGRFIPVAPGSADPRR